MLNIKFRFSKSLQLVCLSLLGIILLSFYNSSQVNKYLQIIASPSVEFVVTNPEGQKAGYNPQEDKFFEEIPGANYGYMKLGSLNGSDLEDPSPEFVTSAQNLPQFGVYNLKFYGSKLSKFEFGIFADRYSKSEKVEKIGIIDKGAISDFKIIFSSDITNNVIIVRYVDINSFRQDLELSYKIGWISNEGIHNSLLQKLNNAYNSYNRGQIDAGINTLQAFNNEVKAQRGKKLTEDATTILTENAELLIQKWEKE